MSTGVIVSKSVIIVLQVNGASVLWRCWLGGRKGIRPVKNWVVGYWHGCLELGADLHMAQLMPLPLTVSCFSKIQIDFTFLVPAHLWVVLEKGPLNGCVCVCVLVLVILTCMLCSVHWCDCLSVSSNCIASQWWKCFDAVGWAAGRASGL